MILIGICGFQGVGKDTFANYLVSNYNFIKYSFASATKDVLTVIFGWDRALLEGDTIESRKFREIPDLWWSDKLGIPNLTPRKVLQMVGTELFRKNFNDQIWIFIVEKKILSNSNSNIIISDCRFPNEIDLIKKLGGKLIHIHRNRPEWFDKYKSGIDCEEAVSLHLSDTAWIREQFDFELANCSKSKELFEYEIFNFIKNNFNGL